MDHSRWREKNHRQMGNLGTPKRGPTVPEEGFNEEGLK